MNLQWYTHESDKYIVFVKYKLADMNSIKIEIFEKRRKLITHSVKKLTTYVYV